MAPDSKSTRQLLVEGRDDRWSIINLIAQHGMNWDDSAQSLPFVRDCQGVTNLLDNELPLILSNKTAYHTVGVVLDADLDCTYRWAKVRQILQANDFPCDARPVEGGFVADDHVGTSRVGVWVMPNNRSPGVLEDFLAMLVPGADSCWQYCDTVVDEAKTRGAPFADADRSKAKIHTWLAWREEPGIPFGQALTQKCLLADPPIALSFVDWFRRLYGL